MSFAKLWMLLLACLLTEVLVGCRGDEDPGDDDDSASPVTCAGDYTVDATDTAAGISPT